MFWRGECLAGRRMNEQQFDLLCFTSNTSEFIPHTALVFPFSSCHRIHILPPLHFPPRPCPSIWIWSICRRSPHTRTTKINAWSRRNTHTHTPTSAWPHTKTKLSNPATHPLYLSPLYGPSRKWFLRHATIAKQISYVLIASYTKIRFIVNRIANCPSWGVSVCRLDSVQRNIKSIFAILKR